MAVTQEQSRHSYIGPRILASAEDLICTTFSGGPGVERELSDPLLNSISRVESFANPLPAHQYDHDSPPRGRKISRAKSSVFRRYFTMDVDLDSATQAFTSTATLEAVDVAPGKTVRCKAEYARKAILVCDFTNRQEEVLLGTSPETVMRALAWKRICSAQRTQTRLQEYSTDHDRQQGSRLNAASIIDRIVQAHQPTLEPIWQPIQSAAVQRLQQLSWQLTGGVSNRTSSVSAVQSSDWRAMDFHWDRIRNEQRLRTPERRLAHERSSQTECDYSKNDLDCPCLSCHRESALQEVNLDLDCQTPSCCPTGASECKTERCEHLPQSAEAWVQHMSQEDPRLDEPNCERSDRSHSDDSLECTH